MTPNYKRESTIIGVPYEVIYRDRPSLLRGSGHPAFSFLVKDTRQYEWLLRSDLYSTAVAFIRGDFDIHGDIIAAIRFKSEMTSHGLRDFFASLAARLAPRRIESWFQTPLRAARNIRFHYDRSNDLYRSFLDSRMIYSCAYFKNPGCTLDEAQSAKLDHICRKLDLRAEDRFLDVGCGWGALVVRAAEKYGARADGCTLSRQQDLFAAGLIAEKNLEDRVMVHECDYRSVVGRFNKIASVGCSNTSDVIGFGIISARSSASWMMTAYSSTMASYVPRGPRTARKLFSSKRKYFPEVSSHVYLRWSEKLGEQASRFWMWKISGLTTH
jgi:hypothetical protein